MIRQRLLENGSTTLMARIFRHLEATEFLLPPQTNDQTRCIRARFHCFRGYVHHYYRNDTMSRRCFNDAQVSSGLEWHLSGTMGKRTKFQQKDCAQLVVDAKSLMATLLPALTSTTTVPLNDDTLLEEIHFTESSDSNRTSSPICPIDQCILMAFWFALQ